MYAFTHSHTLVEVTRARWLANRNTLTPCDGWSAHNHVRRGRRHATELYVDSSSGAVRKRGEVPPEDVAVIAEVAQQMRQLTGSDYVITDKCARCHAVIGWSVEAWLDVDGEANCPMPYQQPGPMLAHSPWAA